MGHLRVYTISDVMARFKRLRGYKVIHPMGWDAFGLPAENAAIERGINPSEWTEQNIGKMKSQMSNFLADFDWDREVNTSSPDYYKFTQKIFLMMYERGLVYQKEAEINWDPVDMTVLANEQVDAQGKSWRSGAIVEKKLLKQWFIGITKYAKQLNQDLDQLDWPERVKLMQKNWIGESHGAEIVFPIDNTTADSSNITVFTSRPDTLFSVQFLALSMNHPIVTELAKSDPQLVKFINSTYDIDSKAGYKLNLSATIPMNASNEQSQHFNIPIYVAPYVIDYGHGAVMGCPGHDTRDFEFWKLHQPGKPVVQVVANDTNTPMPYTEKTGSLQDSSSLPSGLPDIGEYKGMTTTQAQTTIVDNLTRLSLGKSTINYRIRDWLISRQRYWGAPIPIIHCESCGPVAVPDEQLPVVLPVTTTTSFKQGNPLANVDSFVNCKCPKCNGPAKRETDTMDTFMDSSWYYFRYLDSKNTEAIASPEAVKDMPVNLYIGGIEHAILHLLYSRFISKFLNDAGVWHGEPYHSEPFTKLITQGMVHGKTYSDPDNGRFLKPHEVDMSTNVIHETGKTAAISFEKMSKSKYNGADPGECIAKYGADATRAHMLFSAPISDVLTWNEDSISGIDRWLRRVISMSEKMAEYPQSKPVEPGSFNHDEVLFYNEIVKYVSHIEKSIEVDFQFNTIVSDMMKMTNLINDVVKNKLRSELIVDSFKKLLVCMSSATPATAEECWEVLGNTESIFHEAYPECSPIELNNQQYNIFINGKMQGVIVSTKDLIEKTEKDIINEISKTIKVEGEVKKIIKKSKMISIVC
ncbi:Leucine--tRNA ligase mitochondrial [Spathaspora sp. JA1]|nr:Leucine--tRNA ligase mitochondrial [Spathaspora sp. JA1]